MKSDEIIIKCKFTVIGQSNVCLFVLLAFLFFFRVCFRSPTAIQARSVYTNVVVCFFLLSILRVKYGTYFLVPIRFEPLVMLLM